MDAMKSTSNIARVFSLVLAICTTTAFADTTHEKAPLQALHLSRISIGLAAVESISLPPDWKRSDREPNSTSTDQYFHAVKAGWLSECKPMLIVRSPYKCTAETIKQLENLLSKSEHQLSVPELSSLSNLICPGTATKYLQFQDTPVQKVSADHFDSAHTSGQTVRIDGKMNLIVEQTGNRSAPCIFRTDGSSDMPNSSFWSCSLYTTLPGDKAQDILLDMYSIFGLDDECIKAGSRIVRTVKWTRASK